MTPVGLGQPDPPGQLGAISRAGARDTTPPSEGAAPPGGYYGRAVLKEPVWKWEVPAYLFTGGLAGASATLALGTRWAGNRPLRRAALMAGALGVVASPPLLIADLGRPDRFINMWRVAKVTSPMSVGTWVLTAFAPALGGAAACEWLGRLPRVGRMLEIVAGGLGPVMATYTAVLVGDTAVPAWHGAHRQLPTVFAATAAATAGAASVVLTPVGSAGPARRLAVLGSLGTLGASHSMKRRLGEEARHHKGRLASAATALLAAGATALALAGPRPARRPLALVGAAAVLAGGAAERFAVVEAGRHSARASVPVPSSG